ncbi:type IX secretion system outer membrane channel protein PorV [Polluticoccus soli]|uniref:type IX secretion system outer membrane channel protein PorV n=1 Tax=Polluticoccus soli TaxID=3034150 RepID=UPI0023E1C48B|nr:type IX secretion system outer membrane channel protein PorV [Flavipsychrobacter sp. JY13-12]
MAKRFAFIGLTIAAGLLATSSFGQTNINGTTNTITTAVPFLRISPDARSGAMGDVGIAISPDANAQYWNLSKLPFAAKPYGISMTYTPWLKDLVPDIFLAYLSGYSKFGQNDNQAISASFRYFSLGEINYTDAQGQSLGTGKPNELALDLGYSRRLSENLSAGLGFRYIHSAIASGLSAGLQSAQYSPGNAVGADLGVYYTKTTEIDEYRNRNLSLGAILSNVGSKISYTSTRRDFIPINLGLGGAYTYQADEYNKVTFALDLNKLLVPTPIDTNTDNDPVDQPQFDPRNDKGVVSGMLGSFGDAPGGFSEELKEFQVSVGAEYWYQNQFAVRAGYFYENKDKGDRKYLTVGLGVRYQVFNLNFSYLIPSGSGTNRNPLSNTLRFSLLFEFDRKNKDASTTP